MLCYVIRKLTILMLCYLSFLQTRSYAMLFVNKSASGPKLKIVSVFWLNQLRGTRKKWFWTDCDLHLRRYTQPKLSKIKCYFHGFTSWKRNIKIFKLFEVVKNFPFFVKTLFHSSDRDVLAKIFKILAVDYNFCCIFLRLAYT